MYPIPANATRIRYLESTGTQYIDTGVLCDNNTNVEIGALWNTTSYNMIMFGVLDNSSGTTYRFMTQIYNQNNPQSYWGASTSSTRSGAARNEWHDYALGSGVFKVDGSTVQTWADVSFTTTANLFVLARSLKNVNDPATIADSFFRGRVRYVRITKSGVLVRDFVPVRVGTVGYLFDRVSGQLFGNAGTGDFVLGPDTFSQGVLPTRMCVMGVRKKLPYDAEVEYIEIGGDGAFIDTGVTPQNSPSATIRAQYLGTSQSSAQTTPLFGRRVFGGASKYFAFWVRSDTLKMAVNWGTYDTGWQSQTTDKTAFHDYALNSSGGYFDGTNFVSVASGGSIGDWTGVPLGVGGVVQSGGASALETRGVKLRIASFALYNGGVLAFDGIAVRKGQVGYLYDKVSKQLFGNAGTGAFTIGPDK